MPDHINLPGGGKMIGERDGDKRDSTFHKAIVRFKPIPNTKTGNVVELACGHVVQTFGNLQHCKGKILCQACMDQAHANG